jgi:monoamine oxidase
MRATRRTALKWLGVCAAMGLARPALGKAKDADLIVIGAGLSGMHAARLAQDYGMTAIVLEASARAGGRVLTLDDVPGAPNAGGSQIGASYGRMRSTAGALDVEIVDEPGEPRDLALSVGGRLLDPKTWGAAAENPFPARLKTATPGAVLFRTAAAANPLKTNEDWLNAAASDLSAAEFLQQQGLDAKGLALADVALNANALGTYSMLNVWRSLVLFREDAGLGPSGGVKGGAQRLTEAMAASLKDLRLNARVLRIEAARDSVAATLEDGTTVTAPFAICTLPFAVLRKLTIGGGAPKQRAAIDAMPYTQIAHIYFEAAVRFWDKDGLPPDTWSDGPLERMFAVRDRATGRPNGVMLAWLNGTGADWIKGKSDADLAPLVADALAQARPAAAGPVKVLKTVRWTDENPLAGGAYMHFAPGQIAAWKDTIAKPLGNLFVAGEHLSRVHTGMEGALESAETAFREIMARAGR